MKSFWPRILSAFSTLAVGLVVAAVVRLLPPPAVNLQPPCAVAEVKTQPPPAPQSTPPPDALEPTPTPAEPQPNVHLQFTNYSLSEKAEGFYNNAVDYPQLTVLTTAQARRFNRYVEGLITGRVKDARRQGREIMRDLQRKGESQPTVGELTTSYEILFASRDFISIVFTHSYYWTFHPISSYESVNYDLKTGRALRLGDIFKPKVRYLRALSKLSRARLLELLGSSLNCEEGTAPLEKNFAAWNLTPDGLVISFTDYQVGPYAVGAPSVTLPLAEVRGLLKTRYLNALKSPQ